VKVLVVEDSRTLADALVEGLQDEAMAVDVAYDGLQAAMKLDLNTYDVVVLDRDLPGMHGDTICRMITERENPAMVLMLTASGTPAQRVSGLSLGARAGTRGRHEDAVHIRPPRLTQRNGLPRGELTSEVSPFTRSWSPGTRRA